MAMVVLALGLLACESPGPWVGEGPRVAVLGDSLVFRAQNENAPGFDVDDLEHRMTDELNAAGFSASVGGNIGESIPGIVSMLSLVPEPAPDILVIAGGSNDANNELDVDVQLSPLRHLLDTTDIPCVVLVTVSEAPGDWNLDAKARPFNDALRAEAEARDHVVLADWTPLVALNPDYVASDGAHMNETGRAAYRQLIVDGARACAARLG